MSDQNSFLNDTVRVTWVRWWELFHELLSHTLSIAYMIGFIAAIEWFMRTTQHGDEIIFFKKTEWEFPLQYLLDAADLSLIVCISAVAIYTVAKGALRR